MLTIKQLAKDNTKKGGFPAFFLFFAGISFLVVEVYSVVNLLVQVEYVR